LSRRSAAKKGTPRTAERGAPQASHLEFGLIVFLALAATQCFIWLAIRGPALLERISSWRPICSLLSCETQSQLEPKSESESEPQPQPQALSQPQAQHQTQPQPPLHPPTLRRHMLDGVVVGESPPLTYWIHYSPRLSEPPRRSPIECWRHRSILGLCFEQRSPIQCWRDRSMRGPCFD
jgi:hypothetical protein